MLFDEFLSLDPSPGTAGIISTRKVVGKRANEGKKERKKERVISLR